MPLPNTQTNCACATITPQAVASAANSQSEKQSAASQEALSYVKGLQDRLHTLELGSLKSKLRWCERMLIQHVHVVTVEEGGTGCAPWSWAR